MNKNNYSFLYRSCIPVGLLFLVVFGTLMITSAEMGVSVGETGYLTGVLIKQIIYSIAGLIAFVLARKIIKTRILRLNITVYWMIYGGLMVSLLICRLFGQINGAYAWIPLPFAGSIQPSEFCKTFMILFAARIFYKDQKEKNTESFKNYIMAMLGYVGVILAIQKDLGSAMVLLVMCFCMAFVVNYKELVNSQVVMFSMILFAIFAVLVFLSPWFTNLLMHFKDDYRIARFLAAANPFMYRYDSGYHLVMSLVSFANGGLLGMGYGNSTHKYMNFPNPSNDFILPVIVEELGIFGFIAIVIGYGMLLYPLISYSLKTTSQTSRIVLIGVFMYFVSHFIFNVGGVSGFIPLTGVPLLIISSGGSSLVSCCGALGLAQGLMDKDELEIEEWE